MVKFVTYIAGGFRSRSYKWTRLLWTEGSEPLPANICIWTEPFPVDRVWRERSWRLCTAPQPNLMWLSVLCFSVSFTGQADKWNMSFLMLVSMYSVNRCMGVCYALITSSNDIVPTAMKAWPEECPPLVFFFPSFSPPPHSLSLCASHKCGLHAINP